VLPAGLSFNSSTGAISGSTSVISASANYLVTVTDANGATASGTFSLAVNKAASAVALSASAASITPIQQVTFTASVSDATPGSTGAPTGTIIFLDNGVQLASVPMTNGTASVATSLSPGITHSITAVYSGDVNFQIGSSTTGETVAVVPLDFTLAAVDANTNIPLYVVPGLCLQSDDALRFFPGDGELHPHGIAKWRDL
jgi:hypothetical protein